MLVDLSAPFDGGLRRMRPSEGELRGEWVATVSVPERLKPWLSSDGLFLSVTRSGSIQEVRGYGLYLAVLLPQSLLHPGLRGLNCELVAYTSDFLRNS